MSFRSSFEFSVSTAQENYVKQAYFQKHMILFNFVNIYLLLYYSIHITFLLFGIVAMLRFFVRRQGLLLLLLIFYIPAGTEAASSSSRSLSVGNETAVLGYNNVFSVEQDYRQNFCNSRNNSDTSSTLFVGDVLNGKKINVMIVGANTTTYFNYDEETGIDPINPGFYANVLDMMAEQGNFTWYVKSITFWCWCCC